MECLLLLKAMSSKNDRLDNSVLVLLDITFVISKWDTYVILYPTR